MIKCEKCKGDKFVMGMGNMREKCTSCGGKGFVSDDKVGVKKTKKG